MSEQDTNVSVTDAESNADGQTPVPEGDGPKANKEARYRVERNEARTERDALAQRVETLLTREAERVASKHLAEPADLFTLTGKTVKDFVGEDGELDTEAVVQAANDLLGSRPGLGKHSGAFDPSQGHGGGPSPKPEPSWDVFLRDE